MPLTLVTGPANSAKAGEVLSAYAAACPRGAILVVPTAADVAHYARELAGADAPAGDQTLAGAGRPAVLGTVTTFDGLHRVIAERVGVTGRVLTPLQRGRLLAELVAGCELDALAASARGATFPEAAGSLITELQRALVTPQRFTQALRAWAAEDVRRAPLARDLGRIYSAWERALQARDRDDRERFARRALDGLRADPEAWARGGRDAVFVYGFDDLTALERDAVQTLAHIPGVAVTVSLTYEPGRAALVARAEAVQELAPLAAEIRELPAVDTYYADAARTVLHRLERELFEDVPAPGPGDPDGAVVTLLEAGGERAEAELVAAEARALIAAGTPAAEIVVVHRSPDSAVVALAPVFAAYGVPFAARGRVAFAHTPLGRALLGAARCAWLGDAATPGDLIAYLRAPGLLRGPEGVDDLEAEVGRRGLRRAAQARTALGWELGELDSLAAALHGRDGPAGELLRLARRLLAAPHRGAAAQLAGDEELDARAFAALHRGLAELAELGPLAGTAPEPLLALLATLPVTVVTPDAGAAVSLAAPAEIRARRFAAVFVCGLQEGEFPRPGRPDPFLPDERRRELALAAGLRLRPREEALAAERALFYAAISRATERVFLAYRSSDEEGNLALASPFVADVAAVLGERWRDARRRRLLADVTWPAALAPTPREAARAAAAARAPLTGDAPEPARRLGPQARSRVRHTRIVSAGALEAYADCPVRWLVERELQVDALEPESDALTRGSLVHAVLEALIRRLGAPVSDANLAEAEALLAAEVSALAESDRGLGAGAPEIVRAGALRGIEADLRRYLRHEAARGTHWTPVALERQFGFDDPASLPPLVLGTGEDEVRVRGYVDRIDTDGLGRAIVRDYKSGGQRPDWPVARWRSDRRLQVALYMLVVRELEGLDPVAGVYQPLRGEELGARGVVLDELAAQDGGEFGRRDARPADALAAELADAAERAVGLAAALRAGEVVPCPATCSPDGCAHPAICRSR